MMKLEKQGKNLTADMSLWQMGRGDSVVRGWASNHMTKKIPEYDLALTVPASSA